MYTIKTTLKIMVTDVYRDALQDFCSKGDTLDLCYCTINPLVIADPPDY